MKRLAFVCSILVCIASGCISKYPIHYALQEGNTTNRVTLLDDKTFTYQSEGPLRSVYTSGFYLRKDSSLVLNSSQDSNETSPTIWSHMVRKKRGHDISFYFSDFDGNIVSPYGVVINADTIRCENGRCKQLSYAPGIDSISFFGLNYTSQILITEGLHPNVIRAQIDLKRLSDFVVLEDEVIRISEKSSTKYQGKVYSKIKKR